MSPAACGEILLNNHVIKSITMCCRDDRGRLILMDDQGREYRDVRPIRMFPITDPEGWISICDSQLNELLCIESLEAVPAESRRIFKEELNRCMFTPLIQQITRLVPVGDDIHLFIVTDRGPTAITVNTEDIYRLSEHRILIKDVNGARYLIPNWNMMSPHSQKALNPYL